MSESSEGKGAVPETPAEKLPSASESDKNGINNSNYHYENDKCIYTDPVTNNQLEWNEEKKEWITRPGPQNPPNDSYVIEDGTYVYTDKSSNVKYKWDKDTNSWLSKDNLKPPDDKELVIGGEKKVEMKKEKGGEESEEEEEDEDGNIIPKKEIKRQDMSKGHYGYENDTHTFTDATDGTVYEWDKGKNAWFPKVDDEFLAQYQMSYGFVQPSDDKKEEDKEETDEKEEKKEELEEEKDVESEDSTLKRKLPQQPTWFEVEPENNTKVYVSNLPLDITEQEFVDLMQKCGLVMKDLDSGKMKIKLYTEPGTNSLKGDALCTYIKIESVDLALKILDGYEVRGQNISVERAKFTMKGDAYNPSLKPKKRRRKDKEKLKKMQEKLFAWHPDKLRGQRGKNERVVIVKNLFDPTIFDKDVGLILEYQQDIREECLKCGDVKRVTIYDKHPEGVAQIMFKEAEAADACLQLLNNRWFGQRQITAETWDGKTKYKIAETEAEIKERIQKWDSFLEKHEESKESKESSGTVEEIKTDPDKDTKVSSEAVEETKRDSDQDTRSSAGSDDETDEDEAPKQKSEHST